MCDLKALWNFESVSRETRELEGSSSGGAGGPALLLDEFFLRRLLKKLKKKGPDVDAECERGRSGLDLGTPKKGVEEGSVCIWGLSFLCETKGEEMYFVQKLNFRWRTARCNLSGQSVWTTQLCFTCRLEPRIDKILVFCTS